MKTFVAIIALFCLIHEINCDGTASTIGWTSPHVSGTAVTVTPYTNGYVISFTAAGLAISDNIDLSAIGSDAGPTIYVTPTSTTATAVGWGPVMTYSTASTACDATALTALKALSSVKGTGTSTTACPGDMLTQYTASPTGSPTTTSDISAYTGTGASATAVYKLFKAASGSQCYTGSSGLVASPAAVGNAACTGTGAAAGARYIITGSGAKYAFYVEQVGTGASTVCVQTTAQYGTTDDTKGKCGTVKTSSASLVSAFLAPVVLVVLMIFA